MSTMLADRMLNGEEYKAAPKPNYPREHAGPVFFATNSVKDLQNWPSDRLRLLGPLPFPIGYSHHSDRYEIKLWGEILRTFAQAITTCEVITLIGGNAVSAELESLQILLHHNTGKIVELMQCSCDTRPGHVWSSTDQNQTDASPEGRRVVIALGCVPRMSELGELRRCTSLFINDYLTPAMFEISGTTFAVPMSRGGWRLSHIAFRRLLDIETEMSRGESYRRMLEEADSFARPMCYIMAELFKLVRDEQSAVDVNHS